MLVKTMRTQKKQMSKGTSMNEVAGMAVSGLTKRFGRRTALDDISFSLPQGAFLTVFGANGAGKTTLLKCLATLSRPTSGAISLKGVDALEHPEDVRSRIGMISHSPMLYPDLTAEENLVFYGRLYGVEDAAHQARKLLEAVGLKHRRDDRVRTFSRGMTQRVSIARAFMNDPDIVFLDEPYAGLDPHAIQVFDRLIEQKRERRTFCLVSHNFRKGIEPATHILVLRTGKCMFYGSREDVSDAEALAIYQRAVGLDVGVGVA